MASDEEGTSSRRKRTYNLTANDVFTLLGLEKDTNNQESDSDGSSDLNFSDFELDNSDESDCDADVQDVMDVDPTVPHTSTSRNMENYYRFRKGFCILCR
ncbi:Hypothetical predicted protein [Paramuricea clavata]|uniref:Uncharacterized protein n=1 Tax=Paramuricea clavata TaxID=317549 RepID=A0A7D9L6U5_PARCT|nr:Hypothetical predicted protein [Paramuricea clavata]